MCDIWNDDMYAMCDIWNDDMYAIPDVECDMNDVCCRMVRIVYMIWNRSYNEYLTRPHHIFIIILLWL